MNGVHDLGGMHGFGPIEREDDEPYWHEPWERRVFGLFFGCFAGGHYNLDAFRHAIEQMGPAYFQTSYYEHWLHAMEALLVGNGTLTREQIAQRMRELAAAPAAGER
jgi:nitrile hydratase subunit beta